MKGNSLTNKDFLVIIISIVFFLVLIVASTYAYFGSFSADTNNRVHVNITTEEGVASVFTSEKAALSLQIPPANMSEANANNEVAATSNATFNISLDSASTSIKTRCTYDVIFEYDSSSKVYGKVNETDAKYLEATKVDGVVVSKELTMKVTSPTGTNNYSTETNFDYNSTWSKSDAGNPMKTLVSNATIISEGTKVTNTFTFELKFYNLTTHQANMENETLNGYIYAKKTNCENIS